MTVATECYWWNNSRRMVLLGLEFTAKRLWDNQILQTRLMIMSYVRIALNDSVSSRINDDNNNNINNNNINNNIINNNINNNNNNINNKSSSSNNTDDIFSCTSSKICPILNSLPATVKYIRMFVSCSEYVSVQQARCLTELPLSFCWCLMKVPNLNNKDRILVMKPGHLLDYL